MNYKKTAKFTYLTILIWCCQSVLAGCANGLNDNQTDTDKNNKLIAANWQSMAENYQVPEWFVDGKIGIWTHWGIPSAIDENRPHDGSHYGRRMYGTEGFITPSKNPQRDMQTTATLTQWHTKRYGHPSEFGYEKFIPSFKAENWDPEGLVKFFKQNGARFIMPVATHHDNFDMYDSSHPWNAVDMGPKRDTIQEWKDAATKYGLKFGVSTHLYWAPRFFNAARQYQKPNTLEWQLFAMDYHPTEFASQQTWNKHWFERSWELIEKYDPDMFNNDSPYPSDEFGDVSGVALFSDFINRDLLENNGKQTRVLSFKDAKKDKAAFTYNLERGMFGEIQTHPWMWATDVSGNWFYRKNLITKMSVPVLLGNAVDAISKNGVVMMNVALRGDGTLPEEQAAYIRAFGDWININGEGIYATRPWKIFGEGPLKIVTKRAGENLKAFSAQDIRFTYKDNILFAFVLAPPENDIQIKALKNAGLLNKNIQSISMLGSDEKIHWHRNKNGLTIKLPETLPQQPVIGFKILLD
ncbi:MULTISPECIES: alpha-L-fucosidase [Aliiglaciecola]|uniref:alpha-L-fucosidase n=1 Tax=Aliiglaciecola TaxID=1406885 RepID=UPI001C0A5621|nr:MULTISPECIES: alpha-L-fucosidase [Aliiglaciecola]MBU2877921.1 alpha-L-fucosidase [Aliiglaciecola lipolytica]MDO6709285.1 alpha-L-fucosidase [Aliiglaciecola sp. 2_MG-2023]MDO6750433.1 alpha-L-fucosidase [Aliiglaciecola sp. 1_MG-2023]